MTIQNLIGSGMDPKTENNPYLGFIYTSFQVHKHLQGHMATQVQHVLQCTCRKFQQHGTPMGSLYRPCWSSAPARAGGLVFQGTALRLSQPEHSCCLVQWQFPSLRCYHLLRLSGAPASMCIAQGTSSIIEQAHSGTLCGSWFRPCRCLTASVSTSPALHHEHDGRTLLGGPNLMLSCAGLTHRSTPPRSARF